MKIDTDYLIIGASAAGVSAAIAIRERQPEAKIAIISKEPIAFYSRVLLPKFINGGIDKGKLILRDKNWFAEQNIELYLDEAAEKLDSNRHALMTSRNNEFTYNKLLIATGVRPAKLPAPGSESESVFYLWNLADAEKLKAKMDEAGGGKIVVIGGGFICQSFVNIFSRANFDVNLLMRGKYYWSHFVDEYTGKLLNEEFEEEGVVLHQEERVKEISKSGNGLIVQTEKGREIQADIVLVGVGMIPNTAWLEGSGIELDDGVRVDEFMKTNLRDVYAAGDVVNF